MNPILFRYGGFALHYSHVIFLAAFWLAYWFSHYSAEKSNLDTEAWERALTYFLIGAVLFGRLGYVLSNLPLFWGRWRETLTFWHGAFTVWGTIFGFFLAALILEKRGFKGIQGLDIIAAAFPLFLGIAQWGRFTEGEGWGRLGQGLLTLEHSGSARYPVWLGFFLWYLLTAMILTRRKPHWDGERFLVMSGSMALASLVLTPLSVLVPGQDIIQYAWGILFLLATIVIWIKKK